MSESSTTLDRYIELKGDKKAQALNKLRHHLDGSMYLEEAKKRMNAREIEFLVHLVEKDKEKEKKTRSGFKHRSLKSLFETYIVPNQKVTVGVKRWYIERLKEGEKELDEGLRSSNPELMDYVLRDWFKNKGIRIPEFITSIYEDYDENREDWERAKGNSY